MTSDRRITRRMVQEDNLVDRYLLGQMGEAEAMAFEDFYAGSPETLDELETSARLIDSMKRAAHAAGDSEKVTAISTPQRGPGALRNIVGSPAYGVAASFVALVAVLFAVGGNLRSPGTEGSDSNAFNFPVVTLSPTRGGESSINIPAGDASQIVFALDVGIAEAASYSAALHTRNGDMLWRADGLKPDALQSLTMSISRDSLAQGDYRIIVRDDTANGDTLTYPFSIVR